VAGDGDRSTSCCWSWTAPPPAPAAIPRRNIGVLPPTDGAEECVAGHAGQSDSPVVLAQSTPRYLFIFSASPALHT
jgi:hypothetical protein